MDRAEGDRDTGGLAGVNCHAVVVGTGRYPADGRLTDLPSAPRSAEAFAETLRTVCGMADRVTVLTDPTEPTQVLAAVAEAVTRSEGGVVLFSFVGHGLLGPGGELYLATSASESDQDSVHSVPYGEIKRLLEDSRARPVVLLDCCFSGLARAAAPGHQGQPYVSARPEGSFLLASATHYGASFAPEGQEHTAFTGELLRLLCEGDAGGPKWLTLSDVYRHLDRAFREGPARPYADSAGRMGDLALAVNPGHLAGSEGEPRSEPGAGGPCPYPGMRPFQPDQSHLFFGREELTRALVDRVTTASPGRPVVLVGPSGVGKSSLLRAGLGAALNTGGSDPVVLVPAPGARPFRTLTECWAQATGRPFQDVERDVGAGRFSMPVPGRTAPGVLLIDQFEEIFTHCQDAEERELFVRALSGGPGTRTSAGQDGQDGEYEDAGGGTGPDDGGATRADEAAPGPRIVLALRADYYGQCLRDPRLARLVQGGQFTIGPMTDDELRSAVESPAAHAGLRLEDGLSDLLLRELRQERVGSGDSIALPFLAHALQETWIRRSGIRLTFAAYQATGGIRTSVIRAAERLHSELDEAGRRRLRELLLSMVRLVDGDGRAVRRRVRTDHLGDRAGLLDRLTEARLVVVDDGEAQLCHDSLLHAWPRLRGWINEDLDALLVRRRLGEAADAWDEAGRPASGLYAGKPLAAARSLMTDGGRAAPSLRPVEHDFLQASGRTERRRRNGARAGIAALTVLAVLAASFGLQARSRQKEVEGRENILIAKQLAAQADSMREQDPEIAMRLSLAAYRAAETSESRSSLYASFMTLTPTELKAPTDKPVLRLAFSSDGKTLAATHRGGRVQLWDVSRPTRPRRAAALHFDETAAVTFRPGSHVLVTQTDTKISTWDATSPDSPKRLAEQGVGRGTTYTLAFSPDGTVMAAGSAEGEVRKDGPTKGRLRMWDLSRPARPLLLSETTATDDVLRSLAFSHDGTRLVTGNGGSTGTDRTVRPAQVKLWDVTDPRHPALRDTVSAESVQAVAFHPQRDQVVATGADSSITSWTVSGGELAETVGEHSDGFWGYGSSGGLPSLSFRPDGKVLAAASASTADPQVLLRKAGPPSGSLLSTVSELEPLPAGGPVQAVAYRPDSRYLAAGDQGGSVRLWPQRPPAVSLTGELTSGDPGTSPISDDGHLVITTEYGAEYGDRRTRVWDLRAKGEETASVHVGPRLAFEVPKPWEARYFLPGRNTPVLVAHQRKEDTEEHTFKFWDFGTGGTPRESEEIRITASAPVTAVSPDGRLLAVASENGRVETWDLRDALHPVRRSVLTRAQVSGDVSSQMFFVDKRALATLEDAEHLRLWDLGAPDRPIRAALIPVPSGMRHAAVLHTQPLLITDGVGEEAQLWDVTDIHHPRKGGQVKAAPGSYYPLPGRQVAAVRKNNSVAFWDVRDPRHPEQTRTMRFDQEISSISVAPDDHRVLTNDPYRIWSVGKDGRWLTPSVATVENVSRLELFTEGRLLMAAVPDTGLRLGETRTLLLDFDTDAVYEQLCDLHPEDLPEEEWKELFTDIAPRRSCD